MVDTVLVPTLGAILIGIFISIILYGATSMQAYYYFQRYGHTDRWALKALITLIWSLETIHLCLICATIFRWLIRDYGDRATIGRIEISDDVTTGITALIILLVHCFYARRLWILSNNNILLVSVVLIIAVCHFGFEMAVMALACVPDQRLALLQSDGSYRFLQTSEFRKTRPYFTCALAFAAANDSIIAVAMFYLLGPNPGVKSTNTLTYNIGTYFISTGILTSIVDIVILICFVAMPNNLVYLAFYDFVNNLYASSLLALLNARESPRDFASVSNVSTSLQFSDLRTTGRATEPENTSQQHSGGNLTEMPWASIDATTGTGS